MKLYTLVGLPGCGKSTYARSIPNAVVISTDAIRKELLGSEENQSNGNLIFSTAYSRIQDALDKGFNVVFDATNLTRHTRKKILEFDAEHIAVVFNIPINECKRRNKLRERHVPETVIDRMANKFCAPSIQEGFQEIIVVE